MADTKISELPVATAIASPDVAPIVQGGETKQADVSLFGIKGSIADKQVAFGDGVVIAGDDNLRWDLSGSVLSVDGRINVKDNLVVSASGTAVTFCDPDNTAGFTIDSAGNFGLTNAIGVSIDIIVSTANGYFSVGPPMLLVPQASPPASPTEGWVWEDATEHKLYWFDGTDVREIVDTLDDVLKLEPTTAPASPVEGMIYANASDHHLYFYNGTTWKQLDNVL